MKIWTTHGLEKVFADAAMPENADAAIVLTGAAGECEVGQIVVQADEATVMLHTPVIDSLRSEDAAIDVTNIRCRFVELVPVRFPSQGLAQEELERYAPGYFPDPLCLEDRMQVPLGQCRSIWVQLRIPQDTAPGTYSGRIAVSTDVGKTHVPLQLTVWPIRLPEHIPFSSTLWVWPFVLAKYHAVALYSEPFWDVLARYATAMAAHRQDTILTQIVGPDTLIDPIQEAPGRYRFDFTKFDRWVNMFLDAGFEYIEGGHLYDNGYHFFEIHDEPTGKTIRLPKSGKPTDFEAGDKYIELLAQLLPALRDHLAGRGWADRYFQHIYDEPMNEMVDKYLELARFVRDIWPDIRLIEASDDNPVLLETLDVLVPLIRNAEAFDRVREYAAAEKTFWCYNCNHPRGGYPATFLDVPVIKVRILPWICWRYGVTGYLYYAMGYWERQHTIERHAFDPYTGKAREHIDVYNPWLDPAQHASWRCPPGSWGYVYPPRDPQSQDPHILTPRLIENFIAIQDGCPSVKEDEAPLPDRLPVIDDVVGSIRWEQLREGIEDFGLLSVLQDAIDRADESVVDSMQKKMDAIVHSVAADWESYTRDPAELAAAREAIANLIMEL